MPPDRGNLCCFPDRAGTALLECYGRKKMVLSSLDREQKGALTLGLFQLLYKFIGIFDRFPVDFSDDIPRLKTRLGGRAPGFHLSHHYTPSLL